MKTLRNAYKQKPHSPSPTPYSLYVKKRERPVSGAVFSQNILAQEDIDMKITLLTVLTAILLFSCAGNAECQSLIFDVRQGEMKN
jgi:hypothetical protein